VKNVALVDKKFKVSAENLSKAIKRVGSSAKEANVSLSQLVKFITKAQEKTERDGDVIGNSLKTVFTRLQYPDTLNKLEDYGIKVKTVRGVYRRPVTILREVSRLWCIFTPKQKCVIAEVLGGLYQVNLIKAIFNE
jgi:TP901 family phage tail tape measure protein